MAASSNGHLDFVKYLIQKGCNKNEKSTNNDSPLHYAASQGNISVVEYLISIGVNINDKSNDGKTPLDYAKENQYKNENCKKVINLLIKAGTK